MAKTQDEKDKSLLGFFSGSNPNRKKVRDAIEKRKKKNKKKKRKSRSISNTLGM